MFSFIRTLFSLFVVALIAVGGYLFWKRVELVENLLSKQLHSQVHLKSVTLGMTHVTLHHLRIKNPPDSLLPYHVRVKTLTVEMKPWELLKDTITIDEIAIDHPTLPVEILALPFISSKKTSKKQFIVEHVKITHLHLVGPQGHKIALPEIPLIEIHDMKPLAFERVGGEILASIYGQAENRPELNKVLPPRVSFYEKSKEQLKKATKKTTQFFQKLFSK